MTSSASTQYEKDFLREWLKLRDEKKRIKYAQILEHAQMYLHAREFDTPGRRSDEERVNTDRLELKNG